MSLTADDLQAIKHLVDASIGERFKVFAGNDTWSLPEIIDTKITARLRTDMPILMKKHMPKIIRQEVRPRLDTLEKRLKGRIEGVRLDIGMYSHEVTDRLNALGAHTEELLEKLENTSEMTDSNRVAIRKINHKLGPI